MQKIFKKYKIESVIHLAAQAGVRYSLKNPRSYIDNNINGFFNILDISKIIELKNLFTLVLAAFMNSKKISFKGKI